VSGVARSAVQVIAWMTAQGIGGMEARNAHAWQTQLVTVGSGEIVWEPIDRQSGWVVPRGVSGRLGRQWACV
jgi:hypothetical protein